MYVMTITHGANAENRVDMIPLLEVKIVKNNGITEIVFILAVCGWIDLCGTP